MRNFGPLFRVKGAAACGVVAAFFVASFVCKPVSAVEAERPRHKDSTAAVERAGGEEQTQTLRNVLYSTYMNSPILRAARSEYSATYEALPQALSGWQPTVSAEGSVTATDVEGSNFGGGDGSTAKSVALSFNQPLFRGGRTLAQTKAARYIIQAQAALLSSQEQRVLLRAVEAYMDVLSSESLLELKENNQAVIARQLEAAQTRFDAGELTRTDVSQAESRLARARSSVISAKGDLRAASARFETITAFAPQDLMQPDIALDLPQTLDEAIVIAERESPSVLAALNAHRASEEDIDNVFGELLPELNFFGSWNKTLDPSPGLIDEQTSAAVGVLATIPLYQAGGVRSRVRQAKHTANRRFFDLRESRRQAREDVVTAWEVLEATKAEILAREAQVLASQTAREGVHAEADLGVRTVLDSLDADQELLDSKVALVTARRDKVVAEFTLLYRMGRLTPETLGFEPSFQDLRRRESSSGPHFFDMHVDRLGEGG